jgi:hypothetical protein
MWRLHVLAAFLVWYGLMEVGLEMLDGSYYRESIHGHNFPAASDPTGPWGEGD